MYEIKNLFNFKKFKKIEESNKIIPTTNNLPLKSLSLFVGTGECNARCAHCAGVPLRQYAPKEDGIVDEKLIEKTVKECYQKGARYLSISSSGEPTLSPISVTKVLQQINNLKSTDNIQFNPINLYSNGIRIGEDEKFAKEYLNKWQNLDLTTLYITVHSIYEKENAEIYGVQSYPSLKTIVKRIHDTNLQVRANLVLSKKTISSISTYGQFRVATIYLQNIGVDKISAWPMRDLNDKPDKNLSPLETELNEMEEYIKDNPKIVLLREKSKIAYQTGQKLTLFPDGTLSNTWCN
jgi:wyosine [tRNA(Phe)-imidazoG37] synthetase (radical SAM superfamily)